MKYWLVVIIYLLFSGFILNSSYSCSTNEKGIVTGGACSIQDIQKQKQKQEEEINKKVKTDTKQDKKQKKNN